MKQIIQIENMDAKEIAERFDKIEILIQQVLAQNQKNTTDGNTGYLTRTEVASKFKVSLVTISDWVRKGFLKAYKCGNRVYFIPDEVENALKRKR